MYGCEPVDPHIEQLIKLSFAFSIPLYSFLVLLLSIVTPSCFFCADILLGDFLVAENSPLQSDTNSPVLTSERSSPATSPRYTPTSFLDGIPENPTSSGMRFAFVVKFPPPNSLFYILISCSEQ